MNARTILPTLLGLALLAGCTPDPKDVDEVLENFEAHAGQRILLKTKLRSGARCRIGTEEGQWKTYCKGDCQYCSGPVVVASTVKPKAAGLDDWPMILGGIHDGKPIKCQGPAQRGEVRPLRSREDLRGARDHREAPPPAADGHRFLGSRGLIEAHPSRA